MGPSSLDFRGSRVLLVLALSVALSACPDEEPPAEGLVDIGDCPDDPTYFEHRVWAEVLAPICVDCHNSGGLARGTDFVLQEGSGSSELAHNFDLFASFALSEKETDGLPLILTKPTGLHSEGHGGGAVLGVDSLGYEYLATMVGRLRDQLDDCNEGESLKLDCDEPGDFSPGRRLLRRLSHDEYDATVEVLLELEERPESSFAPDNVVGGYDNNAGALVVSSLLADQYRVSAEEIAEAVVAAELSSIVPCSPQTLGEAECAEVFVQEFGARAFRRPMRDLDVDRYMTLYSDVAVDSGFEVGIQWVITATLQSPHYLYRSELGAKNESGSFVLSDWELASELSYLLWGTMPDDDLFAKAEQGILSDESSRSEVVADMLVDPRAAETMVRFSERWLHYTRLETVTRDAELFPEFTDGIRADMVGETQRLLRDSYLEGQTLEQLFLGQSSPMTPELAAFYGLEAGSSSPDADGFAPVSLTGTERLGFLSQGSILTTHALPTSSSPIHRGLLVRERLLCQVLPPPPPNIDASPPEMDPTLSTRERYAEHAELEECAACHRLIDPVGFSFEHFDAVGRWRDMEGPHEIDATGEVVGTANTDATFDGLRELSELLATSPDVESCYVRQWMRFGYGVEEQEQLRCEAQRLSEEFSSSGARLDGVLPALTNSVHFLERLGEPSEGDGIAAGPFGDPTVPGDDDDATGDDDDAAGDDDDAAGDDDDATGEDVSFELVVNDDWVAGYCATVTVTNIAAVDVTWTIEVEIEGTINSIWNAEATPTTGDWVQFNGVAWNAVIPVGQSRDFGFCAQR